MIISFAQALKGIGINYQSQLLVEASDLSDICAYMTYIQLSLYGIPAIVYCRDTLSMKTFFKMETPLYFLQYWKFRKLKMNNEGNTDEISTKESEKIIKKPIEIENLYKEAIVKGNCQISLW